MSNRNRRRTHFSNPHINEMLKIVESQLHRHDPGTFFTDCLTLWSLEIQTGFNLLANPELKQEYDHVINKYSDKEKEAILQLSGLLMTALNYEMTPDPLPSDVLGQLYEGLNISSGHIGQYFTPEHICECMALITIGSHENVEKTIQEKGYFSILDPCVGSGRMLYGALKALASYDVDFQSRVYAEGEDIDIRCVHMTFIQLSLYGIPARVIHGNSLVGEPYSILRTPMYIHQGWASIIEPEFLQSAEENQKAV